MVSVDIIISSLFMNSLILPPCIFIAEELLLLSYDGYFAWCLLLSLFLSSYLYTSSSVVFRYSSDDDCIRDSIWWYARSSGTLWDAVEPKWDVLFYFFIDLSSSLSTLTWEFPRATPSSMLYIRASIFSLVWRTTSHCWPDFALTMKLSMRTSLSIFDFMRKVSRQGSLVGIGGSLTALARWD